MLLPKEFERLKSLLEKDLKKAGVQKVLDLIEKEFLDTSPLLNTFNIPRNADCISKARPNREPETDALRQKEVKDGFKVRTQGEGERSDEARKNNYRTN